MLSSGHLVGRSKVRLVCPSGSPCRQGRWVQSGLSGSRAEVLSSGHLVGRCKVRLVCPSGSPLSPGSLGAVRSRGRELISAWPGRDAADGGRPHVASRVRPTSSRDLAFSLSSASSLPDSPIPVDVARCGWWQLPTAGSHGRAGCVLRPLSATTVGSHVAAGGGLWWWLLAAGSHGRAGCVLWPLSATTVRSHVAALWSRNVVMAAVRSHVVVVCASAGADCRHRSGEPVSLTYRPGASGEPPMDLVQRSSPGRSRSPPRRRPGGNGCPTSAGPCGPWLLIGVGATKSAHG
jgi:hypothetical protein